MPKFKLFTIACILATGASSIFAMSLCEKPAATGTGSYTNSPTCVAATETTNKSALAEIGAPYSDTPPYVAALEPVLDQDIQRYIFNSYYRYINFPVGQSFTWYLNDGDPSASPQVIITPVSGSDQPEIEFKLQNVFNSQSSLDLPYLDNLLQESSKCNGSIFSSYTCPTINDYFSIVKTLLPELSKLDPKVLSPQEEKELLSTINFLGQLSSPAVEAESTSDGPYLSVRYVETCSGGLISNGSTADGMGKVFTAGHCYYGGGNSEGDWDSANTHKVFVIGNNWQTSPYVAIASGLTPNSGNIAPGYAEGADTDYAIVNIKTIPGYTSFANIKPFEISSERITAANAPKMFQVGFGQTEPFTLFNNGAPLPPPSTTALREQYLKSMSSPVALLGQHTFQANGEAAGNSNWDCNDASGAYLCAGNTQEPAGGYGDSGGPLFSVDNGDNWYLYGHFDVGGFDRNQSPGGFNSTYYLCSNPALKKWINSLDVTCVDEVGY